MKGGTIYRLRGNKLSFILIVLICTTIVLWAWEKTPLVTSLLPAQDQLVIPYSEYPVDSHMKPSQVMNPTGHFEEDFSDAIATGKTGNEPLVQDSSPKKRNEPLVQDSSPKKRNEPSVQDYSPKKRNEPLVQDFSVTPISSATTNSTKSIENIRDLATSSTETKVCNYAKGSWVADKRRPLYSGFGCKQWLSGMWACRLTQRMDFSYEGFRWQPENCEMPEFEGSAFLRRMQDKTIAFVGDSLGRQQFQSFMCMVTGGKESPEVQDVGWEYGLVKARGAIRPDGWAYRFPSTNTTILYYWSASLCDLEPLNVTDPGTSYAMHLDRPVAFLRRFLDRFNVLVLNTGHHWNRGKLNANRWVMYVNGMPNKDRKRAEIWNAKNFAVSSIIKWVNSQLPKHPQLKAFFRTISPRHFRNGDWNTGGNCDNTTPLTGGSKVSQDEPSDPVVADAAKGTGVKILDITPLSELRDEGHISRYSNKAMDGVNDCLHWCLPGIPDTWNEILAAQV